MSGRILQSSQSILNHTRFQFMKLFSKSQDYNFLPSLAGRERACKGALSRTASAAGTSVPAAEVSFAWFTFCTACGVSVSSQGRSGFHAQEKQGELASRWVSA